MKNSLKSLFIISILIACEKKEIIEKQTVFENLEACYPDTVGRPDIKIYFSDTFDLINVKGKLTSFKDYASTITLDKVEASKVPRERFPIFEKRFGIINACNMPADINSKDYDAVDVKLSCKVFYEPPPSPGLSLPSTNGSSVELYRIEILK